MRASLWQTASCEMPPTMLHFNCEQSSMSTPGQTPPYPPPLLFPSASQRLKLKRVTYKRKAKRKPRSASEACFNLLMGIYRTVTAPVTVPIFVDPLPFPLPRLPHSNPVSAFDPLCSCDCDFRCGLSVRSAASWRVASHRVASSRTASRNLDY